MSSIDKTSRCKGTILVIDDNPDNLALLSGMLREKEYSVQAAISGSVALQALELALPDLILLDIKMPEMDGYEVCRQLKANSRTRDIPVVFISAMGEVIDKVQAFNVGGVDYITKPFQFEEVLARVGTRIRLRAMQKGLSEANAQLRRSQEELERRVEARTAELSAMNERLKEEIQERKKLEEERIRMENRLSRAQKMEAIGTLAGGIAHDFNNILTPIIGYSELALDELPATGSIHDKLMLIFEAAKRAKDLVGQILTFCHQTEQQSKPARVSLIIKEVTKFLRASLPSTIRIELNIAPDAMQSKVLGDPTQLHQILMNLCVNAGHAMRETGGFLELSLSNEKVDEAYVAHNHDAREGSFLKLSVSDTGHGMSLDVMQRIFDPYFTTKGPGDGTGLGLAVVYGIVKSYGGWISVESEPGNGSTFHVFLPRLEETIEPESRPGATDFSGQGRVLIVDDELIIAQMEKEMLEKLGFDVVASHSSLEALDIFRSQPDETDLVITDLTMPGLTGLELAKELLKIKPDLPIILCTGFSDTVDRERVKAAGISELVLKPIDKAKLAELIRDVLNS